MKQEGTQSEYSLKVIAQSLEQIEENLRNKNLIEVYSSLYQNGVIPKEAYAKVLAKIAGCELPRSYN